ncbi:MAG: branched-chain amino acid ABC transporter permease, partial [Actinobacteria bacterium]|nr:branched-chain amino acid ABC transporter permease [Actinomycetota bacterium]
MSQFLNLLAAGLTSGAIYGIFGACLSVWFRVCNVLNLAVGDFAMLGAIGTAVIVQQGHFPLGGGIVVVLAAVGIVAWGFDRLVLHFAFDRGSGGHGIVSVFFYTFGLSLVLEGAARAIFGTDVHAAPAIWAGPALSVADFHVQRAGLLVIGLAVASGLVLWAYLRFTVSGRAASACGESALGSRIVGIDNALFRRWIFVGTAVLAALFGVVESPLT